MVRNPDSSWRPLRSSLPKSKTARETRHWRGADDGPSAHVHGISQGFQISGLTLFQSMHYARHSKCSHWSRWKGEIVVGTNEGIIFEKMIDIDIDRENTPFRQESQRIVLKDLPRATSLLRTIRDSSPPLQNDRSLNVMRTYSRIFDPRQHSLGLHGCGS